MCVSFCGTILVAAVVAHLAHGAFDVRDFGAKGDGVAEDMVAVHGAIDAADVVSDTNRFSCGSGTVACLSPDSRRILAPYLASEAGRGECPLRTTLPWRACAGSIRKSSAATGASCRQNRSG